MANRDPRAPSSRTGPRAGGVRVHHESLAVAFVATYALFRQWLPANGWQPLAALSGSWSAVPPTWSR